MNLVCRLLLEKLDNDLVELEKRPEDLEILNAIFRYVHTIKGTSSFIGFEQMSELFTSRFVNFPRRSVNFS